ncbi:MAG: ATP-binding protein [Gaiellaceae bacterium]
MSATVGPAIVLMVDDRPQNLLALEAILEPLDLTLVRAASGEEALRYLLGTDVALILMDVQMPGLDGFETAELIKERERTRDIPIIFLTAISKERQHVFRGFESGAVDYMTKPYEPAVLRSKVSVFIDLHRKNQQLMRQAEQLREAELAELRRVSEDRYRFLAESIPDQVWTAVPGGELDYVNRRVTDYFGRSFEQMIGWGWSELIHPDDLPLTIARWTNALETGDEYTNEFRLRRASDGSYRWHLARALSMRGDDSAIVKWFGTNTDIDDRKQIEEQRSFIVEASSLLGSSLDYSATLAAVAELSVPVIADWCQVVIVEDDGSLRQLAVAHADPQKVKFAFELEERYPPDPEAQTGPPAVVRTGKAELVPEITDEMLAAGAVDDLHLDLIRELGLRSYMCVPLVARERVVGTITFIAAESGRVYDADDMMLAEELARRAAVAVDNARLYTASEERARAARVLESVGDAVFLLDRDEAIRLWNPAAEAITGLAREQVLGKKAQEAIPGWSRLSDRVPIADAPGPAAFETVPLELGGRELWLSISGVETGEGTVYAFRDLTEERALEELRQDMVATVSHELRTPLAAIYGSALTLRRDDITLEVQLRDQLLTVIAEESDRLATIVNDLLLASQLDADTVRVSTERTDARTLAEQVIEVAGLNVPETITLELEAPRKLPKVECDPGQLRQVLGNLLENAVKYSPNGGRVRLALEPGERTLRFSVSDEGLGIPAAEQRRVFEKFYRVDPNMSRGIGGTGLGLFICRELVRRVGGRIWVESQEGSGSTFFVELPRAASGKKAPVGSAA